MNHQEAVKQLAVEQYLLGELSGEARNRFEEHLFDCRECTADLKAGVVLLNAARHELKVPQRFTAREPQRKPSGLRWLSQPWVLGPALAACLMVIVYQSAVLVPGMKAQLAESQAPAVLDPLVLANAGARGDSVAEIVAPRHGFYLLSVDIPPAAGALGYRCSLYSPAGALTWQVNVSARQAHDAVTIQVPVMTAQAGMNELRVQSLSAAGVASDNAGAAGGTMTTLATYRYRLTLAK